MADYDLHYWPLPFRGQFLRAIMAYAGKRWDEHDSGEIGALLETAPADQPIPFMGPPVLVDHESGFIVSQMPAIAVYLGTKLDLIPATAEARALTAKVAGDANDVIDELTLDGGREMWTAVKWKEFTPRLQRWMTIFETLGAKHGLKPDSGFLLGTEEASAADIITATLWMTMAERFPVIADLLDETAPLVAALSKRMWEEPALKALAKKTTEKYGEGYCGGEIEKSLRKVAAGKS